MRICLIALLFWQGALAQGVDVDAPRWGPESPEERGEWHAGHWLLSVLVADLGLLAGAAAGLVPVYATCRDGGSEDSCVFGVILLGTAMLAGPAVAVDLFGEYNDRDGSIGVAVLGVLGGILATGVVCSELNSDDACGLSVFILPGLGATAAWYASSEPIPGATEGGFGPPPKASRLMPFMTPTGEGGLVGGLTWQGGF